MLGPGVARAVVVIVAEVPVLARQDRPHAARADHRRPVRLRVDMTFPDFPQLLVSVAVASITCVCSSCHSLYLLQTGVFSDWLGIWKFHKEKTRGLSPIAASTWSRSAGSRLSAANRRCQGTCAPAPAVVVPPGTQRVSRGKPRISNLGTHAATGEEGHTPASPQPSSPPFSTCRRKGRLNSVFYLAMRGRSSCRWRKNQGVRFGIVAHHFREYSFGFVVLQRRGSGGVQATPLIGP
jgi:hypothetical protein